MCWSAAKGESVRANLKQYGLESQYLDMLIADAAKCVWRAGELFDAIITDRECELASPPLYLAVGLCVVCSRPYLVL